MREYLRISDTAEGDAYWVLHNDQKSHRVSKALLSDILAEANRAIWHHNHWQGKFFGEKLYAVLNGTGLLDGLRKRQWASGEVVSFILELPGQFKNLPFEIMWDGSSFLAFEDAFPMIRQVTKKNCYRDVKLENRPISMLFMACSPLNSQSILAFEAEEESIFKQVEDHKLPIDLFVEDSGSLIGLRNMLRELKGVDVIHLSGHARQTKQGPIFEMESETGSLQSVSPEQLAEALKNFEPRLLFLSGCETGRADLEVTESFAHEMVERGVPMVMGWGLRVGDMSATLFAKSFYKLLGEGMPIDAAVNQARQAIREEYKTWSQLRVFCDGTPLKPITDPHKPVMQRTRRQQRYRFFKNSQIKVLQYGFVGRRRQIQQGLQVLKGEIPTKNGLLITGTAGVGKSTLTGKLVDRFPNKKMVIFSGKLEVGEIVQKLNSLFDELGDSTALAHLKKDVDYAERIKALFRGPFQENETLLIFDDFEKNLRLKDLKPQILSSSETAFRPFLEGLPWANGNTQLIVTSRHPFSIEIGGIDRVATELERIPLKGLSGADLRKKRLSLNYLSRSPFEASFEKFSGGNPRLLEWFEVLAEQDIPLDLPALETDLHNQKKIFINEYLADLIAQSQGKPFETFLANASVYRTPVGAGAFAAFGPQETLEKAVDMTLMEKEGDRDPRYWVLPVIRDRFWEKVKKPRKVHEIAYRWYDAEVAKSDRFSYSHVSECLHHGAEAFKMKGCWHHAVNLSAYFEYTCLYREGIDQLSSLMKYYSMPEAIHEFKKYDGQTVAFLNNFGALLVSQGELASAQNYYEQALTIRRRNLTKDHPDLATSLNNLGHVLVSMGELSAAKSYYERALIIHRRAYGKTHPATAVSLNNLGYLLQQRGELSAAKSYYDEALAIRQRVLGGAHPDTAESLNNLGTLSASMGEFPQAKSYFEQALTLFQLSLGDTHPQIAQNLNNLGVLLVSMGELAAAKPYYEEALAIRQKVLGGAHPDTALSLNNIGYLLKESGELSAAKPYYEEALAIRQKVLGGTHPDTAQSLNNLGALLVSMGELSAAKPYYRKALKAHRQAYGDVHPSTASSLNNFGSLLADMGELSTAKPYLEQALAIRRKVLGEAHPDTAESLNNLGTLLVSMGELILAKPYFEQALEININVLGHTHPNTAICLNNLGDLFHGLGQFAIARQYLEKAFSIRKRALGEYHPGTVLSIWNLSNLLWDSGEVEEFNKLIPSMEWLLSARKEKLTVTHRTIREYLIQRLKISKAKSESD